MKTYVFIAFVLLLCSCKKEEDSAPPEDYYETTKLPCGTGVWLNIDQNRSVIRNNAIRYSGIYYGQPKDTYISNSDTVLKYTISLDFPFVSTCPEQFLLAVNNRTGGIKTAINSGEKHSTVTGSIAIFKDDTVFFWLVGMGTFKEVGATVVID